MSEVKETGSWNFSLPFKLSIGMPAARAFAALHTYFLQDQNL